MYTGDSYICSKYMDNQVNIDQPRASHDAVEFTTRKPCGKSSEICAWLLPYLVSNPLRLLASTMSILPRPRGTLSASLPDHLKVL
jgi:hypothetical protein